MSSTQRRERCGAARSKCANRRRERARERERESAKKKKARREDEQKATECSVPGGRELCEHLGLGLVQLEVSDIDFEDDLMPAMERVVGGGCEEAMSAGVQHYTTTAKTGGYTMAWAEGGAPRNSAVPG